MQELHAGRLEGSAPWCGQDCCENERKVLLRRQFEPKSKKEFAVAGPQEEEE